ncbi:MAG: hypothetical protein V7K50_24145 [Nostoc sp.]
MKISTFGEVNTALKIDTLLQFIALTISLKSYEYWRIKAGSDNNAILNPAD